MIGFPLYISPVGIVLFCLIGEGMFSVVCLSFSCLSRLEDLMGGGDDGRRRYDL